MLRIKKLIIPFLALTTLISLSSCDVTDVLVDFSEIDMTGYANKNSVSEEETITDEDISEDENTSSDEESSIVDVYNVDESEIYDEETKEEIDQYVEDYHDLYGYNMLSLDVNYSSLLTDVYETFYTSAYDTLINDVDYEVVKEDSFNYIVIDSYKYSNYRYTDIIASSWMTMIEENPIFYFLFTGYTVKTQGNYYYFYLLGSEDYAKAVDRNNYNKEIIDYMDDFKDEYNKLEDKSDINKATLIHDYICENINYAYDEDGNASDSAYAHNIISLVENSGVCEAYAKLYLLFSYEIDINSLIVLGYSGSEANGHAWNYCEIDGVWYGVDVTWDDSDDGFNYDYFLVSSYIMNNGHTPYSQTFGISFQVPLPTLSATSYDKSKDQYVQTPGRTGRRNGWIIIRW